MTNQKTWEVCGRGFRSMSATQIGGLCDNLHTNVRHWLLRKDRCAVDCHKNGVELLDPL